jgi:insertion element IS1 protein InsB
MHRLACRLQVSVQAVRTWIRTCVKAHEEKPEPTGTTIVLELEELWHDLKQTRQTRWIWNALDRESGQLLDWEGGRHDKATLKPLVDRLAPGDVKLYGTDQWVTYASVIPQDTRVQSHATTHAIERHHGRQRHGFGRFKRKSMIVSQSHEMVHLTMALFAKFWVNGNQDKLLSLLG